MKKIKYLFMTVVFIIFIGSASAQPGNPEDGEDPDASIPLDGGLVTVLVSGAAIGISKLIKKRT